MWEAKKQPLTALTNISDKNPRPHMKYLRQKKQSFPASLEAGGGRRRGAVGSQETNPRLHT